MRRLAVGLGIAAWALASAAAGAEVDALARLERALATTRTLEARLVQERHSALLPDAQRSRGRLSLRRPGDARLEYDTPEPLVLLKRGDTAYVYVRTLRQVQVMPARQSGVPLGWVLGSSLAELRALAEVRAAGRTVEILPRPGAGLPWSSLVLEFPAAGEFPTRFVLRDALGDTVVIRLEGVRRNRALPAGRFAPDWPAGTRRVETGG